MSRTIVVVDFSDLQILDQFLAAAIDATKKAGQVIRKGFYETKHVEHKGHVYFLSFLSNNLTSLQDCFLISSQSYIRPIMI